MRPLTFLFQKIFQKLLFKKTKELYVASEIDKESNKRKIFRNCKEYIKYEIEKNTELGKKFSNFMIKSDKLDSQLANGKSCQLNKITLSPKKLFRKGKPGENKHIIMFYGTNSYFQRYFKDLSIQAERTGATIHAFNQPGLAGSTGTVSEFNDCINSGLSMVYDLLKKGVKPDNIILQGDCLGAAVAEGVIQSVYKNEQVVLRRINGNSFKSLQSVIKEKLPLKLKITNKILTKILEIAGWIVKPHKTFEIGPYGAILFREGDKTVKKEAQLSSKLLNENKIQEKVSTIKNTSYHTWPKELINNRKKSHNVKTSNTFADAYKELENNCKLVVKDKETTTKDGKKLIKPSFVRKGDDIHVEPLYNLKSKNTGNDVFDYINKYIELSNQYINKHPQKLKGNIKDKDTPYHKSHASKTKLTTHDKITIEKIGKELAKNTGISILEEVTIKSR